VNLAETLNTPFFDRVRAVVQAASALDAEGHRILSADLGLGSLKPTIQIATRPELAAAVDEGEACYYKWRVSSGVGGRQQERVGQMERGGCRVVWTERGN
jgi:hypothetical protein